MNWRVNGTPLPPARNRQLTNLVSALVSSCILLVSASFAANSGGSTDGWIIDGDHYMFGPARIFACNRGMRIVARNGRSLVTKPPDWKVYTCDDREKVYAVSTLEESQKDNLTKYVGTVRNEFKRQLKKGTGRRTISGVALTEYVTAADPSVNAKGVSGASIIYWVIEDQTLSKEICRADAVLQGSAVAPGLIAEVRDASAKQPRISAQKIARGRIPLNAFDIPAGYRKVRSTKEVLFPTSMIKEILGQ